MKTTDLVRGKQLRDVTAAVLASEVDAIAARDCPSCGVRKGYPCIRGGHTVHTGPVRAGEPTLVPLYACRERFIRDPWWWLR